MMTGKVEITSPQVSITNYLLSQPPQVSIHQLSVITTQSSTPVTPVMSSTPVTLPQVSIHQLSVITTQSSTPVTPGMSSTPVTPPQVSITNYLLSQLSLILPLRLVLLLLIIIVTIIRPRS